jgi:hypothetical protein
VIALETESKLLAVKTEHVAAREKNEVAMAKFNGEQDEYDSKLDAARAALAGSATAAPATAPAARRKQSAREAAAERARAAGSAAAPVAAPAGAPAESEADAAADRAAAVLASLRAPIRPSSIPAGEIEWLTAQLALGQEIGDAKVDSINATANAYIQETRAKS